MYVKSSRKEMVNQGTTVLAKECEIIKILGQSETLLIENAKKKVPSI